LIKTSKIKPQDFIKEIKEKILFSINNYEKYKDNLILTKDKLKTLEFQYDEVKILVIKPFNKEEFDNYVRELKYLLIKIVELD
jgi:hypothetical protein